MKPFRIFLITALTFFLATFTQHCTSQNQLKEEEKNIVNENYFAPRPLPHSSAEVSCTVIDIFEKENKTVIIVRIDSVHGYGAATRPIGIGTKFEIELTENHLDDSKKSANEIYKINSNHKLLLALLNNEFDMSQNKSWKIISGEK
jgi:hypothetical protein